MVRRALALAFALMWSPALLHAQDGLFTISVSSADVHAGPTTVTPVVGHVSRGTAMPVLRNLGSWVKVSWPDGPDGIGYVHMTMGRLAQDKTNATISNGTQGSSASVSAAGRVSSSAPSSADGQTMTPPRPRTAPHERVAVSGQGDTTPISHVFGVGAAVGSARSVGASARTWRDNRFGLQVGVTHETLTGEAGAGRMTALQIEPAVVFGVCDFVSDYFWIRPYVGSGVSVRHQTLHDSTLAAGAASENGVGYRVFGGSELTFAGALRFALSVDVGYRHLPTPFPGFQADHVAASIAGHWYIK